MGGLLAQLTTGGVQGLLKGVGGFAKDVRAAITGKEIMSPEDKLALVSLTQEMELAAMQADREMAKMQVDLNKVEAASGSFFRGGWRPAVGWTCVVGLLYQFVVMPILPWTIDAAGYAVKPLPTLDTGILITLLMGMLGLGGMRTFEKVRGSNSK